MSSSVAYICNWSTQVILKLQCREEPINNTCGSLLNLNLSNMTYFHIEPRQFDLSRVSSIMFTSIQIVNRTVDNLVSGAIQHDPFHVLSGAFP